MDEKNDTTPVSHGRWLRSLLCMESISHSENLEAIRDIITSHQILHPAEILPKLTKRTPYPNKYIIKAVKTQAPVHSRASLYT